MRVFSRNGDESTSRFPDLIKIINESCKPDAVTFILDAEVKTPHHRTHTTHTGSEVDLYYLLLVGEQI